MLIYVKELAELNWSFSGIITEINTQRLKSMFLDTDKISERDYEQIIGITKKTAYGMWLAKKVSDGLVKGEDIYKWEEYFEIFDRRKRDFKYKDINRYKSEDDLRKFIDEVLLIKRAEQDDPSVAKGVSKTNKYEQYKLGEVEGFSVYEIPKGRDDLYGMSCDLGSGTEWCTASGKHREMFDYYIKRGALYLFLHPDGRKYQFSIESDQYMDKDDKAIDVYKNPFTKFFIFLDEVGVKLPIKTKLELGFLKLSKEELVTETLDLAGSKIKFIPDGLTVNGTLDLRASKIERIGDNVKIEGDLRLGKCKIKKIGKNLILNGRLELEFTENVSLPNDLTVNGSIILIESKILSLPENLTCNGNLVLSRTKINSLPKGLKVAKNFEATNTKFTSFPDDIEIGGAISLIRGKVSSLPENLSVNGSLYLNHCPIKTLPKGLNVSDSILLNNTPLTSLPSDLKVGGNMILTNTPLAAKYNIEQIKAMIKDGHVKGIIKL